MLNPRYNFSKQDSWFHRVAENFHDLRSGKSAVAVPLNSGPLHFCWIDLSARISNAQAFSAIFHVALCCLALTLLASTPTGRHLVRQIEISSARAILPYLPPADISTTQQPGLGREGGGGENDPRPARHGNLAPESSMPLAPPRLIENHDSIVPVPPAVFDANAPTDVPTVTHLGLPWMNSDTDSAGPGSHHGFGTGNRGGMGDGDKDGAGEGEDGYPYANVASQAMCSYCPNPEYTDEARKGKIEGIVTVRVLIGTDGTAKRITIVKGLGMGLDERTVETVRRWRFIPARDARRHEIPVWVTIESSFRLF